MSSPKDCEAPEKCSFSGNRGLSTSRVEVKEENGAITNT